MNRITNIAISRKNKFFSLFYDDYNLEIYNLVEEQKINTNCECVNQLIENKYDNHQLDNSGLFGGKFFKTTFKKFKLFVYFN